MTLVTLFNMCIANNCVHMSITTVLYLSDLIVHSESAVNHGDEVFGPVQNEHQVRL